MTALRIRLARVASVVALVAIIGLPLVLAGHHHHGLVDGSPDCSVCLATHHAPGVVAAVARLATVVTVLPAPVIPAPAAPASVDRLPQRGRAPPPRSFGFAS
ncbi:MAG TPA: hypothetical protein VGR62_00110 [Candidatus Binatia bacterium]|jgi:hypothetical protein|nr:hypothetical protein [Candidatus Binatia bacterium]